jgi:putative nucleotidyltransferase with HDIG domain
MTNAPKHPAYLTYAGDVRIETIVLGARALATLLRSPRLTPWVASILEQDPVLRTRAMSVAEGMRCDTVAALTSVAEAFECLSPSQIHELIVAVCQHALFGTVGSVEQAIWDHCISMGLVAYAIAEETRLAIPEDAFVAGLLCDVGKALLHAREPERFAEATALSLDGTLSDHEAEERIFGFSHADVGAYLLMKGGLPDGLSSAVLLHHDEALGEIVTGPFAGLCEVVRIVASGEPEIRPYPIDALEGAPAVEDRVFA